MAQLFLMGWRFLMKQRHGAVNANAVSRERVAFLTVIAFMLETSASFNHRDSVLLDVCSLSPLFAGTSVEDDDEMIRAVLEEFEEKGVEGVRQRAGQLSAESSRQCFLVIAELFATTAKSEMVEQRMKEAGDLLGLSRENQKSIADVTALRTQAVHSSHGGFKNLLGTSCDRFSNRK
jgi:hypothetical protein